MPKTGESVANLIAKILIGLAVVLSWQLYAADLKPLLMEGKKNPVPAGSQRARCANFCTAR